MIRRACIFCITTMLISTSAWAGGRPDNPWRSWFGHVNGGWLFPQGDADDVVDDDLMISGGAMYWPADWPAGIEFDIAYAYLDISDSAIQEINDQIQQDPDNDGEIDDGDITIWQFTVNGVYSLGDSTDRGFYLTGGAGLYYLEGRLTNQGLVYYPPVCDPFYWWWCYPGGFGQGTIVQASDSTTEFGLNAGVGYSFATGNAGQAFLEARYHRINTDFEDSTYIPLMLGFRW